MAKRRPPKTRPAVKSAASPADANNAGKNIKNAKHASANGKESKNKKPQSTQPRAAKTIQEERYFPPERRGLWPSQFAESAVAPYSLVPRNWREELPHLAAVFFLALLLYGYTTPRLVALEDDGLFISNLHFFGVAHPPGYPVHTLLGSIFYHILPFGTPAFKGHFFSGFAAAGACAAIYAIVVMLVRGRVFAYLGGLAYAASDTFWSQAIIAEVYTLNAMLFFIVMALCLRYAANSGRSGKSHRRLFFIITLVYGLGVANHYPLLGLGSIGLGMMVLSQIGNILPRVFLGIGGILLGAAPPYLLMIWRSGYHPAGNPANFYGPIGFLGLNETDANPQTYEVTDKIVDFGFYFFRSGYSGVDKQSGVGLDDKIAFGHALADDMLWQFTPIGFAFVVIGFLVMMRSRYQWLWLSLSVSWFMSSILLVFLLDFKAEYIWMAAFRVYHLLAFGIMAVWLAIGAAWVADLIGRRSFHLRRSLAMVSAAVVVCLTLGAHWDKNNRRDYRWAHDLAVAKLNSVEPNAVLFTFDDLDLPVGYLHFVEGLRPDLKVYNDQALVYGDRLYSPLTPDHAPAHAPHALSKQKVLRDFIEEHDRPVYYHAARADLYSHPRHGSDFMGFFRRVNRSGAEERIILSDALRLWMGDNVGLHPPRAQPDALTDVFRRPRFNTDEDGATIVDLWTRQQHFSTVSQLVNAVQLASYHGLELSDEWRELIDRALAKNALARLSSNSQKISFGRMSEEDMRRELQWMKNFDPDEEPLLGRQLRANFYWQKGRLAHFLKDEEVQVEETLRQGYRENRQPENPAAGELLAMYQRDERPCDFVSLLEELYPDASNIPRPYLTALRKARSEGQCNERSTSEAAV